VDEGDQTTKTRNRILDRNRETNNAEDDVIRSSPSSTSVPNHPTAPTTTPSSLYDAQHPAQACTPSWTSTLPFPAIPALVKTCIINISNGVLANTHAPLALTLMSAPSSTEAFPIVHSIHGGPRTTHILHDFCMSIFTSRAHGPQHAFIPFCIWIYDSRYLFRLLPFNLLRAFGHSTHDAMAITFWRGSSTACACACEVRRAWWGTAVPWYAEEGDACLPTQGASRPRGRRRRRRTKEQMQKT